MAERSLDLPREYCLLGLRFNRLVDGFVDAYFGDPALARQVQAEPAPEPAGLARRATELAAELPSSGLSLERQRFIAGQLRGLDVSARKLAGEPISFVEEVDAYFQVRPAMGEVAQYAAAHAALDEVLPGTGELVARYHAHRRSDEIPADRLAEAIGALSSVLRDRTRAAYPLPPSEVVDYDVVTDKPWSGFNYYRGDYRSTVAVNADLPSRLADLPHLVAHESYPGHHTEHCRKEQRLAEGEGRAEHTIFLVNTPECLMAEGLADLGLRTIVGPGWGLWAQEVYADLGLAFDGARAEAVAHALTPLQAVRQDAALLLHDRGAGADEVVAHLRRWGLVPEERARKSLSFLTDPLWRAYTSTYVEGYRLLSRWLAAGDPVSRFGRLLDEPLTPLAVQEELAGAA